MKTIEFRPLFCNKIKKIICFLLFVLSYRAIHAQIFPAGFSQVAIGNIYYPTSMAFAPDGRIFATEKAGKVKIVKNGTVLPTPFLQISVEQTNERGLSSVAIDPDFTTNHYVYIYYTTPIAPIHNRLSRFTANGDTADLGSEAIILEFEPLVNSIHNGGGMVFGPDKTLYLAIGNDNVNTNSQDLTNYKGKVIRINRDGSVPAGNPFTGSEPAKRIWAYGLRNPWTMAIQPGTNRIFVDDVGESSWEEINDATVAGRNFGWPAAEGTSTNPAYTNPLYTYPHGPSGTNVGCAITGGTFFNPSSTNYPSQYIGQYFFIDYCNKWINYIDLSSGNQRNDFAQSVGGANNYIKVGNDGNLYYFSIANNLLYKIIYTTNNSPVVTGQPSDVSVPQGQSATFTVSASGALPMTYQWKKNGTDIIGANQFSYTISNAQPTDVAQYSVKITNAFGNTTSNSASLTVTAFDAKPVAVINTPTAGALYRNGDIINFSGSATDLEDGVLPASVFSWTVEFHHDAHIHPGPIIPSGIKSGTFSTIFGETSANVYFRLKLIVYDSHGLTDTAFTDIHPITSGLNLMSQPSGMQLLLDQQPHLTTYSVLAVSNMTRSLGAVSPQSLNGVNYVFDHWSQGGGSAQTITITDNSATYTAVYTPTTGAPCSAIGYITRDYWANVPGTNVASIPVNSAPTSTSLLNIFEGPTGAGSNYASRIKGFICPPSTGNYTFWIASDDNSELWLSTDVNPANKVRIASVLGWTHSREWMKYASQQSVPVALTAGQKYYIEALHKQGTLGDNIAVGWGLPGGTLERPIPGTRLSPFSDPSGGAPFVNITFPINNSSFSNNASISITADATSFGNSISKVEFFQSGVKLGETTNSPYSFLWPNVQTGTYTLTAKATDNQNNFSISSPVIVNVTSCSTPTIHASGPTKFCTGSVVLNAPLGAGYLYQWKKDGVEIPGATFSSYTASVTGSYQIKIISGSCIAWSAPVSVNVANTLSARITPDGPTTFCTGQHVTLYANTCSGFSYQWILNGTPISGANTSSYIASTTGTFQLKVTQSGASVWSSNLPVTVNACAPISIAARKISAQDSLDARHPFQMKIYPNPNNGMFTLSMNISNEENKKAEMKIINILGQMIYSKEFTEQSGLINHIVELESSNPPGLYVLQMTMGDKVEAINILLVK